MCQLDRAFWGRDSALLVTASSTCLASQPPRDTELGLGWLLRDVCRGVGSCSGSAALFVLLHFAEGASLNLLESASCCCLGMVVIRAAQMSQLVLSF